MARIFYPAAVLPALLATACGGSAGGASDAVLREDSAGVEIVLSPASDRVLDWRLEEVLRLGGASDGPESFTRVAAHGLGTDAQGNLYVLDSDASGVMVFGPQGEHLRSMGSQGEGPGELQFPIGLSVTRTGVAAVFDIGKGALVRFGLDGSALEQIPFPGSTDPGVRHFQKFDGGVIVTRSLRLEERRGLELLAWRDDGSSGDTITFAHMEYDSPEMVDFGCMGLALRPLFAPIIRWTASEDFVATATGADYRIDVFDRAGTLLRSIRRDLPVGSATMDDAIAEAEPGMRMAGATRCEVSATEVAEGRGYTESTPAIRDIMLAEDGTLWVERFEPGTPAAGRSGTIDVFDPSGAYLGSLPPHTRFPLLLLPDDRVALSDKDALDIERLVIMTIGR